MAGRGGRGGAVVPSDGALVGRVLVGDVDAFDLLYRRHAPAISRLCRARAHRLAEPSDAVQEVFARALERLDALRDPEAFGPWLRGIARNVLADGFRRPRAVEAEEPDFDELRTPDVGPDERAEIAELAALVRGSMAGLSPRDATAVSLVATLDLSTAELATALGVSPTAAKVALHRARARLRRALDLQLLLAHRAIRCPALGDLVAADHLSSAATHVTGCAVCTATAQAARRAHGLPVDA
jgi:RNA polymerase sigma-70 factor, ECF subfamily